MPQRSMRCAIFRCLEGAKYMDGILLIDKPEGWTSHDVVAKLRVRTGMRRIGHAGTLDPFATGLLIIGIGSATKTLAHHQAQEKEYVATIRFGAKSTTDDRTGTITIVNDTPPVFGDALRAALQKFLGTTEQIPPMYSAKKIGGKKLYTLARQGKIVERAPSLVTISALDILSDNAPETVTVRIVCSSGTYIRALARDLGTMLGTSAYLDALRRTRIGEYRVEDATHL